MKPTWYDLQDLNPHIGVWAARTYFMHKARPWLTQHLQSFILPMNASTKHLLPETPIAPLPTSMNRALSVTVLNPNTSFHRLLCKVNGVDKVKFSAELSKVPIRNGFHSAVGKDWRLRANIPQLICCQFLLQTED